MGRAVTRLAPADDMTDLAEPVGGDTPAAERILMDVVAWSDLVPLLEVKEI